MDRLWKFLRPSRVTLVRIITSAILGLILFYLFLQPATRLKPEFRANNGIIPEAITKEDRTLAELDLKEKVYKEIQARLQETNEWLFRKFTLAGGILAAVLLRLWWPFVAPTERELSFESRRSQAIEIFEELLRSGPTAAILGLACLVSLFVDIHSRRSLLVINELGIWADAYGVPAMRAPQPRTRAGLAGALEAPPPKNPGRFLGWEEFIRYTGDDGEGMHKSLVTAVQTGNLGFITGAFFIFYFWIYQDVCMTGLDSLNRIVSYVVLVALFAFACEGHMTSSNLEFVDYKVLGQYGKVVSSPWSYLAACGVATLIFVAWDLVWGLVWSHPANQIAAEKLNKAEAGREWAERGSPKLTESKEKALYFAAVRTVKRQIALGETSLRIRWRDLTLQPCARKVDLPFV